MPTLKIEAGESDDTCECCNKSSDEVVAICVNDGDNIFMVCKDCLVNAIGSAIDDGTETNLVE